MFLSKRPHTNSMRLVTCYNFFFFGWLMTCYDLQTILLGNINTILSNFVQTVPKSKKKESELSECFKCHSNERKKNEAKDILDHK